jgi:hypothetical protein
VANIPNRSDFETPYSFEPTGTIRLALTTTSTAATALTGTGRQVVISNISETEWAYVKFGDATTAVATTSDGVAIPPGADRSFTLPFLDTSESNPATHAAGIVGANTGIVHIVRGHGV